LSSEKLLVHFLSSSKEKLSTPFIWGAAPLALFWSHDAAFVQGSDEQFPGVQNKKGEVLGFVYRMDSLVQ
jgi:hypothetical protein